MDGDTNALGAFLRARREQLRPEDTGIHADRRRRTPGLRREEVAVRAGISAEYYVRLEQGRDRTPSPQVLDALGVALELNADELAYIYALVGPRPKRAERARTEKVPTGTLQLLHALPMPAFVEDRYLTVLASNALARALSPNLTTGTNRLLAAFLDPYEAQLFDDWDLAVSAGVAQLRSVMGARGDDPRMVALVGELSLKSDRFRQLWARQDVVRRAPGTVALHHPEVGTLQLFREKLAVAGTDDQVLVIYHAQAGTGSAEALQLLGSIAATTDNPVHRNTEGDHRGSPRHEDAENR